MFVGSALGVVGQTKATAYLGSESSRAGIVTDVHSAAWSGSRCSTASIESIHPESIAYHTE